MEDDIKIIKVEYLSNQLLGHTQISDLRLDDQTIFYKSLKWRLPTMEDDLKILKVEYLNNQLLRHSQISDLRLDDQTIFYKST